MVALREGQFASFVQRQVGKSASGILIYGEDPSGVDELARLALRAATKGDMSGVTRLAVSDLGDDPSRLMDEVQSMSLLGDARAVLVESVGDAQLKVFEPVLALPTVENFLVVTAGILNKSSKLRAAFEASDRFFVLPLYEVKADVLERRVETLMREQSLAFSDGALHVFLTLVGDGRGEVMREAEKLALYCAGQTEISQDDVRAICGDVAQFSSDALVDAVFAGDLSAADRALQGLDADGRPVLNMLLSHVARLQELRMEMAKGATADNAIAAAKPMIFFNRRRAFAEQLRALDMPQLEDMGETLTAALLQSRKQPGVADALVSRLVLSTTAKVARAKR
jgi:DNA polymerase III subunit delta